MSDDADRTDPNPSAPPPPRRAPPPRPSPRARRGARLLLGISLMGLLTLVAATVGGALLLRDKMSGDVGEVVDHSFLEVDLTDALPDAPGDGGFVVDPADFPPLLTEATASIRRAGKDPNVTGLYLEVGGFGGGWSQAQELRDAIKDFSTSGKPCYAWSEGMENKDYYIASACSELYLAPAGMMLVNGFQVTTEYYAGTFEKLGVQADFEHVGDFKTAVEPMQRTGPSDAASVAMDSMLDSLYDQFIAGVAEGRKLTPEQARALVDNPPITPEAAAAVGAVNGLKYRDEVREGMAGKERTSLKAYRETGSAFAGLGQKKIAVVHAEGEIVDGTSGSQMFGGNVVGDRSFEEIFEDIREDDDVAAVVLRVNSPGGSGLASDNMWHQIKLTQAEGKPVVVSMGDYAASGGYYISAPADYIVAEPGTLTGSIGVFGGKMNTGGLFEKVGITTHTWQRGRLAGLLATNTSFNDDERAKFREFLEGFYKTFVTRVSDGRKMSFEDVHTIAQGRVWTGAQAKENGLVDELGGLDVALNKAKELGKIGADEDYTLERFPRTKTFFDQLADNLEKQSSMSSMSGLAAEAAAVPELGEALGQLLILDRVLSDGGVAAMLPGRITVK